MERRDEESEEDEQCILARLSLVRLTKLEMIGVKCHSDKIDFDWPQQPRQIARLLRRDEIVLTQVRLKGIASLEGIQFVFNNGVLESPFFASVGSGPTSPESTQSESAIHTIDLNPDNRIIRQISITVNQLVLITRLEMRYAEGDVAFSHTFDSSACNGICFVQEIPEDHVLVGVYGRQHGLDITSIGFVTMLRSEENDDNLSEQNYDR